MHYLGCTNDPFWNIWRRHSTDADNFEMARCSKGPPRISVIYNQSHLSLRRKYMRMLLRVSIPVETGNAAAKAGTLGSTVEQILADLKPEAAYFFADDNGQRAGSIVFDMKDSSEIPAVAEPWFLAFNAKVSFRPIMNPQDLAKAGPSIGKAAERYGK